MHYALEHWYRLWSWLVADNASRGTVILVLITAVYAILTWRMAKAIALQTRAMIQPVALLGFHWQNENWYPESYFEIKNLGTQPLLLLHVELWCHLRNRIFIEQYTLWDGNIIPPGQSLSPKFDFKSRFEREKLSWSSMELSYALTVVVSDLSKEVVLTYENIPVVSIVNVRRGMPLSVRWKYFVKPFAWRYYRFLSHFKKPKAARKSRASSGR